ncbi:MAG: 50S ribosomal protein L25 [Desulfovibrionaceae bacterium]|nr:50S ribosomal protein L25 [Desulfovibrionaceae bacterium]MDD4951301.1 50S ribosomal protein L25 [Desulfovibrionaceae bacterium]
MAEMLTLKVLERAEKGKGPNRRLRGRGVVPGVYYNYKGDNIPVKVEELKLTKLYEKLGGSRVFQLEIDQQGQAQAKPSLIWEMVFDPVDSRPLHVDFLGVDLDKEIKVHVPFEVSGKAKGLVEGGKLEVYRDSCEIICKPMDIPENITLDVSGLGVGDSIQIADVALPAGVKAVFEENYSVLGVIIPVEAEEEAAPGAAEEAEAGATEEEEA